ncbi:Catabolite control protein A [Propionicimonas sp. T2.31MG-18]|uniref:LacI family DNA-binding transcriptional regulator n=1 Tax=Propionicimonas sp. T2.31MG-18 TaxID=3157620 RepID=UPI0035E6334E
MTQGRVSLQDVATEASVTSSVVSRVLNGDSTVRVRPETRARILRAAEKLNYRPHPGARALASAQTRTVTLLIPDLTNPVYARIARGAMKVASREGYAVLISEDTATEALPYRQLADPGRTDGLLIASYRPGHPLLDRAVIGPLPHVFVNRLHPGSGRNVTVDFEAAGREALLRLAEAGHRHVAHIAGPAELPNSALQARAFAQAGVQAGVSVELIPTSLSEEGGAVATRALVEAESTVTAIYVGNYFQALGVLDALERAQWKVPDRVSVISFDDDRTASFLRPPLSTIAMAHDEQGEQAMVALLHQIRGGASQDVLVPTPPRFIDRGSVGPPRSAESK